MQAVVLREEQLKKEHNITRLDTEVIMSFKQGIVEIDESPVVTDLQNVQMIRKNMIYDLNVEVKKFGPNLLYYFVYLIRYLSSRRRRKSWGPERDRRVENGYQPAEMEQEEAHSRV
jgi:hypothetical protein